jgi:phosphonate transport system substrate-binding protein
MFSLKLASCMAENIEVFCRRLADYLRPELGMPVQHVTGIPWQERERLFDLGDIQIMWLCGLPYVHKVESSDTGIELLAVPVPVGPRYGGEPVYFSDVIVKRESPFKLFADLRGSSWAYNEPRSHSGFNVVRAYLARFEETKGFFREVIESGAHTASVEMVLNDRVEGAAIDATVLEWIVAQRPEVGNRVRIIETIGPSPIPPWVVSKRLPEPLRVELRKIFLDMHEDAHGRAILARGRIERFVLAQDSDYDPIRRMVQAAAAVSLS